jgi:ADP-heptose:LPS heptosyltransferase
LDCILPWSSYNSKSKYKLNRYISKNFFVFLSQIRSVGKGSIGIDTRGDIRSVLLLYLAGCTRVITLSHYLGSDLEVLPGAAERVPYSYGLRRWELNLEFLGRLGVERKAVMPPDLKRFITAEKTNRLGIIPVAPWRGKLWIPERWNELIEICQRRGLEAFVLCGPGQMSDARNQTGGNVEVFECGRLEDWLEKLSACSVVVSLDSGPMHLADSIGVPVIALFGQGVLPLWAPSGNQSIVLEHQDNPEFFQCHPIEQNAHLGQKFMSWINVGEVIHALERLKLF